MNCPHIDKMLAEGSLPSPFSTELEDHMRGCARCRALVTALGTSALSDQPSPATLRHIESRIVADYRPVRPIGPRLYFFSVLIATFVCLAGFGVYLLGAFAIRVMSPPQAAVILGALAVCTGLLASSLTQQMVPGRHHWIPHDCCLLASCSRSRS